MPQPGDIAAAAVIEQSAYCYVCEGAIVRGHEFAIYADPQQAYTQDKDPIDVCGRCLGKLIARQLGDMEPKV